MYEFFQGDFAINNEEKILRVCALCEEDGALRVRARDPLGVGLVLEFRPERPLLPHGDGGYSQKGPAAGNASVYLSWTRLATTGKLLVDGEWTDVRGTTWFDHEWGTSQLGPGVVGWDWFSLRLKGNRDLMVYQLRREDGSADPLSSGTFVDADGDFSSGAAAYEMTDNAGVWEVSLAAANIDNGDYVTFGYKNDAPVMADVESAALSYTEGDGATTITSAITVTDADDTNAESATIQITGNYQNGEDVLAYSGGLTSVWDSGTGTLTLSDSGQRWWRHRH